MTLNMENTLQSPHLFLGLDVKHVSYLTPSCSQIKYIFHVETFL